MAQTVAEKLLIKPHSAVWLSHADHLPLLTPMPEGVRQVATMATASTAIVFVDDDAATARQVFAAHGDELRLPSALWVAYPNAKRTDLDRDSLWPMLGEFGLHPNGEVAVDRNWSALRCGA